MSKKNKIILSIVAVILVTATIIGIFMPKKKDKKEYSLYTIKEKEGLTFVGNSVPVDSKSLFFDPTKGEIIKYYVNDKDEVLAGANLFMYENPVIKEQIDELQRQITSVNKQLGFSNKDLSNAKRDLQNAKNSQYNVSKKLEETKKSLNTDDPEELAQKQAEIQQLQMELEASKQEVNMYESQITPAQRAISETNSQLSGLKDQLNNLKNKQYITEKAPISGVVYLNKDSANQGPQATEPVVKIVSKECKIVSNITEFDYDKIKKDDRVDLTVIATGETQKGKVDFLSDMPKEIAPGITDSNENSMSEFSFSVLPDGFIQYGFSVNIKLKEDGLFIPESSVLEEDGKTYIFTVKDGKAKKKEISLMKENGAYKILDGLKLGDKIVENISGIVDGQEIKIKDENLNTEQSTEDSKNKNNSNKEESGSIKLEVENEDNNTNSSKDINQKETNGNDSSQKG
ncbi:MAG: HlyD family efflux transporter periplasmic adaptor subunit [Lagierella massiliensis]|nr:HlyD family efflux transporter periplasmic adaptor subunit [Lagierella massiliensis]